MVNLAFLCQVLDASVDGSSTLAPPWHALKQVTLEALQPLPFAPCLSPRSIEVHVDGSGREFDDGARAFWAFVVLWGNAAGQWFFGGIRAGEVCIDVGDSAYIGATHADSNCAELSGMTMSIAYCLQFCGIRGEVVPKCCHFL